MRCSGVQYRCIFLLVLCILTRPAGSSKYRRTRKNIQRYCTPKHPIRYIYTEYIKTTRDNMKTNQMNSLKTRNKQKMQITSHNHIKWVLCKKAGTGQIDNNIRDGKIKPDI